MFWPPGNCGFGILHRTGFDPTQYDRSQWDYVNETRGFVMELDFQSWAGLCEATLVKRSIHLCRLLAVFLIAGLVGGFNRSSQHSLYGSLGGIRREFPPVFSSRGFFEAGC